MESDAFFGYDYQFTDHDTVGILGPKMENVYLAMVIINIPCFIHVSVYLRAEPQITILA